jgi:hypothetical protein
MAFELSRPRVKELDMNSKRLPWSAPWMTDKEATTQISSTRMRVASE